MYHLETLPAGHVILAVEELLVVLEELVVVGVEELGCERLVLRDKVLHEHRFFQFHAEVYQLLHNNRSKSF